MTDEMNQPKSLFRSRNGVALLVFAAIGGFFLFTEHRAHVLGLLPYLLLLACPLMHMFMHHGHHHSHNHPNDRPTTGPSMPRSTDDRGSSS